MLIVYNADAGIAAGLLDSIHKMASPTTYPCSLCAITYGALTMASRWRDYLKTLPYPIAFYHRPDFRATFPAEATRPLPLIALDRDGAVDVLLSAAELNVLPSLDALIAALAARLTPPPPAPPARSARA